MRGLLLDTHAAVWYALGDKRLSKIARQSIDREFENGRAPFVSAVTMVEIVYLAEKGRIPTQTFSVLKKRFSAGDLLVLPLDMKVVEVLDTVPRAVVPDMPDRIIAATAVSREMMLVSCDSRIRTAIDNVVW